MQINESCKPCPRIVRYVWCAPKVRNETQSVGKFLGFMVNAGGIEVNPENIKALELVQPPSTQKLMQSLNGKVASLSRFISKATDKCIHFFDALKKERGKFVWTPECGTAFQELMGHLKLLPVLLKPVCGEDLYLYLAMSPHALSAALVHDEQKVQLPVYYVDKRFTGAESRYPKLEKLAYCLLIAGRKLWPYFQAHPIRVLIYQPLRQVLHRPETSGRLLKWSIELSQYEITYHPKAAIKGQVLVDFISEFTTPLEGEDGIERHTPKWKLYVD